MRCQFCGWDNPQGKETCEKCNKPLVGGTSTNHNRPTERKSDIESSVREPNPSFNLKSTVREGEAMKPTADTVPESSCQCPECGYTPFDGKCPACGYDAKAADSRRDVVITGPGVYPRFGRDTIRPHRKEEKEGTFTLVPISEDTGKPEGEPLSYEGNNVELNRDNTDPKNPTITSLCQAVVRRENGEWTIEDGSEYNTTFVQASRKIALQSGDLILLGNQLYRFEN